MRFVMKKNCLSKVAPLVILPLPILVGAGEAPDGKSGSTVAPTTAVQRTTSVQGITRIGRSKSLRRMLRRVRTPVGFMMKMRVRPFGPPFGPPTRSPFTPPGPPFDPPGPPHDTPPGPPFDPPGPPGP